MKHLQESVPPLYQRYVALISSDILVHTLESNARVMDALWSGISPGHFSFRYAPEKWTIREVFMHLLDTERIMAYRALCLARQDNRSLAGFDENAYALNYREDPRTPEQLLEEYHSIRKSTIALFSPFPRHTLEIVGKVNGSLLSVRTIGTIIAGHELHHKKILEERYFPNLV